MGGAFLGAMDMKIIQSEAFFNVLSIRQVKSSLHRVKMMSYKEKKIEKKRNLALGVAAVSAVTVFGIILTI